jgi:hypothetical protein
MSWSRVERGTHCKEELSGVRTVRYQALIILFCEMIYVSVSCKLININAAGRLVTSLPATAIPSACTKELPWKTGNESMRQEQGQVEVPRLP